MANSFFKSIVIFLLLIFQVIDFESVAAKSKRKRKRKKPTYGIVKVEGAAVYKEPNFDSQVLDYLSMGQKIRVSKKIYQGDSGFGLFYKTKISKKKYGYIADTEIKISSRGSKSSKKNKVDNPALNPIIDEAEEEMNEPLLFKKYLGGNIGYVNFSDEFEGKTSTESLMVVGFKLNGPVFTQLPLDMEVLFTTKSPVYYKDFADTNASGFMLVANVLLNLPVSESKNSLFYYGLGPLLTYSKYNIFFQGRNIDSQNANMGLSFSVGYLYKLGGYALRAEGKYHVEKTKYPSFSFGVQKFL